MVYLTTEQNTYEGVYGPRIWEVKEGEEGLSLIHIFYGLVRGSEMDEARKKVTEETVKKVEQE